MITATYMGKLHYVSYIQMVGYVAATVCLNQYASLSTC